MESEYGIEVDIAFIPPWYFGGISLVLDSAEHRKAVEGSHPALQKAISQLDGTFMVGFPEWPDSLYWFDAVRFEGRLNAKRAAERFVGIEGVRGVGTNPRAGDYPLILPLYGSVERRYCYMFSWGDCPSGCLNSNWYYFRITNLGAELIDSVHSGPNVQYPAWADTVYDTLYAWQHDGWGWWRSD